MRKKRTPAMSADVFWEHLPLIIALNLPGFKPEEEAVEDLVRVLDRVLVPRIESGEIDSVAACEAPVYHAAVRLRLVPELCGRRPF